MIHADSITEAVAEARAALDKLEQVASSTPEPSRDDYSHRVRHGLASVRIASGLLREVREGIEALTLQDQLHLSVAVPGLQVLRDVERAIEQVDRVLATGACGCRAKAAEMRAAGKMRVLRLPRNADCAAEVLGLTTEGEPEEPGPFGGVA